MFLEVFGHKGMREQVVDGHTLMPSVTLRHHHLNVRTELCGGCVVVKNASGVKEKEGRLAIMPQRMRWAA